MTESTSHAKPPRRILVTGAAGRIGSHFAVHSRDRYTLRLMVLEGEDLPAELQDITDVVTGDATDLKTMKRACAGVDTVVHLAADPSPAATWDELLPNNIVAAYCTLTAAKAAGCRRVVYASSIHAISGYPKGKQVRTSDPVNPGDLYGVSKCFGEALGRYMAEQEGLSCIAIRIGAFQSVAAAQDESRLGLLDAFVSERDLTQLITRCIDAEGVKFAIVHGLSDNAFNVMDLSDTKALVGYAPQDDFAAENPELRELGLGERLKPHNRTAKDTPSGLRKDL